MGLLTKVEKIFSPNGTTNISHDTHGGRQHEQFKQVDHDFSQKPGQQQVQDYHQAHEPQKAPCHSRPSNSSGLSFPPRFDVTTTGYMSSRSLVLGPSREQPLYFVKIHFGMTGGPTVVLHSGPTAESPAAGTYKGYMAANADIGVPGLQDGFASEEKVKYHWGKHGKYLFSCEVPDGQGCWRREDFEMRGTRGKDMKLLGMEDLGLGGRKFIRLGPSGEELVCLVALNGSWESFRKVGEFCFVGSAASGQLGERFTLIAVMLALGVWNTEMMAVKIAT